MKAKPLTSESTAEDYLALHKELWAWLSKHPKANKIDWPRWKHNGGDIEKVDSCCFACEWRCKQSYPFSLRLVCELCLLNWGKGSISCLVTGSCELYERWLGATSPASRSTLALKIANLPLADRWKK
jgi:hypothetical protein